MGLSLKLLGEFALRDGSGAELSLPTRKTRALLGYLAVNADRPQPRERLMALLWSDRAERQARQSLNQALLSIRKLADGESAPLLDSDGERVTLRGDAVDCDVARLRSVATNDPAKATQLYDGPFLDGLSVPDPAFEEWLLATRSELHARACDALATAAETSEDTKTALACTRRLVALDPLREDAHRRLMQLLHKSGDRAGALRQYQACADILKRDLQVEPDAATKTLFDKIKKSAGEEAATGPLPTMPELPPLPDKPLIAVLPFDVIGDDPQAGHLADGLTEDLTAALAKVPELFVIGRHSTSAFKGNAVNVQEVAAALGVRYVLEGSIQKYGNRLRITPQLIDAVSGHHLWAERYDQPVEDVFALQDDIVRQVLLELQVKFIEGDGARIASRGTQNLTAWLLRVQAAAEMARVTQAATARARNLFEAAHRADPNWPRPIAALALTHYFDARFGWSESREHSIKFGIEYAQRAIAMDPNLSIGYQALAQLHRLLGHHDKALSLLKKAAALAPNDHRPVGTLAAQLTYMDETEKAVEMFERANRLRPTAHRLIQRTFALALEITGQVDRAIAMLEELAQREPEWSENLAQLAAAYADAGRFELAQATVRKILTRDPAFTASRYLSTVPFQNPTRTEWLRDLLIKAGLPEGDKSRPRP